MRAIKEVNDEAFKHLIALPLKQAFIKHILVLTYIISPVLTSYTHIILVDWYGIFVIDVLDTCLFFIRVG